MKNILVMIALITFVSCGQSNPDKTAQANLTEVTVKDSTLYEKLVSKFGNPNSIDTSIFKIYKWESTNDEYGRKFKYTIDKSLEVLPKVDTELLTDGDEPLIVDIFTWETPKILVIMKNAFSEQRNGKILSKIEVRIDTK